MNTGGISHEESLRQPQPGGNCLNWVVGHLVCIYDNILPLLGQEPVMEKGALRCYDRGSPQLQDPAEALPLDALMAAWSQACRRVGAGLSTLTAEKLDARAPASPRNNPNETVRSLLTLVTVHQAYHAGQLGLLRRLAGKPGALA
jgi:uncharacterized damage-inducible protein DinB